MGEKPGGFPQWIVAGKVRNRWQITTLNFGNLFEPTWIVSDALPYLRPAARDLEEGRSRKHSTISGSSGDTARHPKIIRF